MRYLEKLAKEEIIQIIIANTAVRIKAIEMARVADQKSGYPELTDCLYHSLAIVNDAIFVTNDKRHISKLRLFGYIQVLKDYDIVIFRIKLL